MRKGATWKWTRHLNRMEKHRYHYPSVIQARDGSVHVTYSLFAPSDSGKEAKSIKHVRFQPDWLTAERFADLGGRGDDAFQNARPHSPDSR